MRAQPCRLYIKENELFRAESELREKAEIPRGEIFLFYNHISLRFFCFIFRPRSLNIALKGVFYSSVYHRRPLCQLFTEKLLYSPESAEAAVKRCLHAGDVGGIAYRTALIAKLRSSFIRWKACFAMAGRSWYSCISCWTVMPCTESSSGI